MKYLLILSLLALAGCSTISEIYTDIPKEVAVAESTLAAAEHTALIYVNFPVCGKTSAILCRTPDMTKKIGDLDNKAYNAVMLARKLEDQTSLQAALTALKSFTSVTDNLVIQ